MRHLDLYCMRTFGGKDNFIWKQNYEKRRSCLFSKVVIDKGATCRLYQVSIKRNKHTVKQELLLNISTIISITTTTTTITISIATTATTYTSTSTTPTSIINYYNYNCYNYYYYYNSNFSYNYL